MDTGGSTLSSANDPARFPPFTGDPAATPLSFMVFDLETSGLEQNAQIRVGVAWSSKTNWPKVYYHADLLALVSDIESTDVVVSYNGKGYDRWVLSAMLGRQVVFKHHIDLCEFIYEHRPAFEKGWKLEDVAQRQWNIGKGRPSSEVVALWATDPYAVTEHCLWDVYLTRCLLEHLRDEQWLWTPSGSPQTMETPAWWRNRLILPRSTAPSAGVTCLEAPSTTTPPNPMACSSGARTASSPPTKGTEPSATSV